MGADHRGMGAPLARRAGRTRGDAPQRYAALAAQGLPMTVIARDTRRVIVEKPMAKPQS